MVYALYNPGEENYTSGHAGVWAMRRIVPQANRGVGHAGDI